MAMTEALVGAGWADAAIYTSPDLFELEQTRIFKQTWLYLGHDSEVRQPGDYQRRQLAGEPVIMVRDRAGQVRAFLNRCRHRGNLVCQYAQGNAQFFRCQYHGWTFSNTGSLVGVPYPESYGEDFAKDDWGLTELRLETYRGLVFVSFKPDIEPLDRYLGPAAELIDLFVDQSPVGEIEVRAGVQRSVYQGNWKFVGMDGYHTNFVHRSVELLQSAGRGEKAADQERIDKNNVLGRELGQSPDKLGNKTYDYGNGHVRLDSTAQRLAKGERTYEALRSTPGGRQYIQQLEELHGPERARVLICAGDPHVSIFPNLQIIGVHLRVIEPLAADRTVIAQYPATLAGAPEEINLMRLRRHEWFFSPAGFGSPDDYEVFERNQRGLEASSSGPVLLSRGLGDERVLGDRVLEGSYSDEVTQRAQVRRWAELMDAGAASTDEEVPA